MDPSIVRKSSFAKNGLIAFLVTIVMTLVAVATWFGTKKSEPPDAGTDGTTADAVALLEARASLAKLQTALASCQSDRKTCDTALATSQAQRNTCDAALAASQAQRNTCDTALAASQTERNTCDAALAACQAERNTCDTALAASQAERNACNTALAASQAERNTCNTALSESQYALRICNSALDVSRAETTYANASLDTCNTQFHSQIQHCESALKLCRSVTSHSERLSAFTVVGNCARTCTGPCAHTCTGPCARRECGPWTLPSHPTGRWSGTKRVRRRSRRIQCACATRADGRDGISAVPKQRSTARMAAPRGRH